MLGGVSCSYSLMLRGQCELTSMQLQAVLRASDFEIRQCEKPIASDIDISKLFSQFAASYNVISNLIFG
jgi:hypothetical protein